jgi:hypothetical protein
LSVLFSDMSGTSSPSVDELLDRAEQDRLREETHRLLYGDLDEQPEASDNLSNPNTHEGDMELDESLLDDGGHSEQPHQTLSVEGFGDNFLQGLQKFLDVLRPYAGTCNPDFREKVYSAVARTKVTEEARKVSAPLYEELLDAMFADRKIRFKKAEPKPLAFTASMGLFCPCEMIHAAVLQCPHFADRHTDLCQQAILQEERRVYDKRFVTKSTQTDKIITPTVKPATSQSEAATATASTSASPPASRGGYGANRGFSRGGHRGRSSGSSDRGRGNSRSKSRRRDSYENRNRSRSQLSRENRDTQDYNHNQEHSVSFESRRSPDERGRSKFKKPYQPAQDRLRQERQRMEEPDNRQRAEDAAARAKREADKISRELGLDVTSTRPSAPPRKGHGDSVFGPDGQIDYSTAPRITPPEGMDAIVTIKENRWDVQFVSKSK